MKLIHDILQGNKPLMGRGVMAHILSKNFNKLSNRKDSAGQRSLITPFKVIQGYRRF